MHCRNRLCGARVRYELRTGAVRHGVPYATTLAGAQAMAQAMEVTSATGLDIVALQDLPQWELARSQERGV